MKPTSHASPPLLAWIVVLLMSVGLNLYWLASSYRTAHSAPATTTAPAPTRLVNNPADDDDDNEEDDTSWLALSEELRQTRRELAECQANHQTVSR